ncbi:MAG: ZIP family metal transporter [Pirellulales bacterium]
MKPELLVALYAALTFFASLAGGWIPVLARLTHAGTQLMMSVVAGLMLGVGVFHMLPHAVYALPQSTDGTLDLDRAVWWTMVGLLATFFLQRFFHFHQHELPEPDEHGHHDADCSHHHEAGHAHDHGHAGHQHGPEEKATLGWLGITLGLVLHTLMDGVALAAAVESEARTHGEAASLAGVGVFLAIFLHKPLDAMAVSAMMLRDGWSSRNRLLVNALFALICPLGAGLFYLTVDGLGTGQSAFVGCALAFSAGAFLCISLSDLLPEIQFHSHDRGKLSLALLLGVALAYSIGFLEESGHSHQPTREIQREKGTDSSGSGGVEP